MSALATLRTFTTALVVLRLSAQLILRLRRKDFVELPDALTAKQVTIVIVALNEERQIAATVERLVSVCPEGAIIVSDDGSNDHTVAICEALAADRPTLTVISSGRHGKMAGLREAVKQVHTPFVLTVDADTLVDPGAVEALISEVRRRDLAACAGNMRPLTSPSFLGRMQAAEFELLNADRQLLDNASAVSILPGAFTMWRSEKLRELVSEARNDIDLTFDALRRGWSSGYCEAATCETSVPDGYAQVLRQRRRWARRKILRAPRSVETLLDRNTPTPARLAQGHILLVHVVIASTGWLVDVHGARVLWRCIRRRASGRDAQQAALYLLLLLLGAGPGLVGGRRRPPEVLEALLEGPWERSTRGAAAWSALLRPQRNDVGWQPHR